MNYKNLFFALLVFSMMVVSIFYAKASPSGGVCSGTTTLKFKGSGHASGTSGTMLNFYNDALTQCNSDMASDFKAKSKECISFCKKQSTQQFFCNPVIKADKAECDGSNRQCSVSPGAISCTVKDEGTMTCSCEGVEL